MRERQGEREAREREGCAAGQRRLFSQRDLCCETLAEARAGCRASGKRIAPRRPPTGQAASARCRRRTPRPVCSSCLQAVGARFYIETAWSLSHPSADGEGLGKPARIQVNGGVSPLRNAPNSSLCPAAVTSTSHTGSVALVALLEVPETENTRQNPDQRVDAAVGAAAGGEGGGGGAGGGGLGGGDGGGRSSHTTVPAGKRDKKESHEESSQLHSRLNRERPFCGLLRAPRLSTMWC